MAKKAVKTVAKKSAVKLVVRTPRGRRVSQVSAEALERAAQDDPIVALAAERKLRLEAEERIALALAQLGQLRMWLSALERNLGKLED